MMMMIAVEVESSSELAALASYLVSAGVEVEDKHWWTGGRDADTEGDWVWSSSLTRVGEFLWSPGQPDGGQQQNCLYLNPHYGYTGRDDNCHIRKQPLCQGRSNFHSPPNFESGGTEGGRGGVIQSKVPR